jgi:hypothetical protein
MKIQIITIKIQINNNEKYKSTTMKNTNQQQ